MILITGGAGYIGSHAVVNFLEHGYSVLVVDNLSTGHIETINTLKDIGKDRFHFEKIDLINKKEIEEVFEKYKDKDNGNGIEGVIHFAAYSLVGESVENPSKYFRNNVVGSLNLLDTMKKFNINRIVFSSTCATYGNPVYTPIDEKHPQNPINPYGHSKLMIEFMLKDFDIAYGIKYIALRYFNVVGADSKLRVGEWHDPETHLVPNILKSSLNESRVFKIFGDDYDTEDGTCIRDYVNVEDLAEAHRLAYIHLDKNMESDVFNLGTEKGSSVKEVFSICEKVIGKKIKLQIESRRAGDPDKLYANADKIKKKLNWNIQRSIENSIRSFYEWEKILESRIVK